ncbi:MAG: U32 family peptidase [Oscillospiraceae bacterium]|nr:U32 family peptidase [Oscillospiraceae bacterium]MBR1897846.1 U32 family peptidase [Oscillospiraceae bacterium]
MIRPEVLAPAGDRERLQAALDFGADAVYLGGNMFGMRAGAPNFDAQALCEAVQLAHARGVKVYLTVNTLPRSGELKLLPQFIGEAVNAGVDAAIVADLGVFGMVKKLAPDLHIHMSTQTGIVNYATANALYEMGAKRVVLARELSLEEIAEIRRNTPEDLEIEVFVHGAMCVSFSGRCLLSAYFTDRDANRGACSQPCRWKYALVEEKRPGLPMPIEETPEGTYILNARDMCMIDHIDKLAEAGVTSFKIEGRAKSAYYVSVVTNAYRMAMDTYLQDPAHYRLPEWIHDEVFKVSHRRYCTGFFFGHPNACQYYENAGYISTCRVVGIVEKCENGRLYATQRGRFFAGDTIEILAPGRPPVTVTPQDIRNVEGEQVETVNHAMMPFSFPCDEVFPPNSILRMPEGEDTEDKTIE